MKKTFYCINPSCNKLIVRNPGEIEPSGKIFCSNSCAAKINNKTRNLKRPKNHCSNKSCNKEIKRDRKYCSVKCQWTVNSVNDEEYKEIIIERIKEFYQANGRIPFKQEMWGIYNAVRKIFGTWNKAIIAAEFKPNPVKFANKYIAEDGHKCDSLAEKIIDDWLFTRNIKHETKVPYDYHQMTADFKIGNIYVEFFGLQGQIKKYDKLVKEKEVLWREKNLKVIKIYPSDLFPNNKLGQIFAKIAV
ncbi:MAG: hypothetical protein AAB705_02270 [Patescibacteria group bacterium]